MFNVFKTTSVLNMRTLISMWGEINLGRNEREVKKKRGVK